MNIKIRMLTSGYDTLVKAAEITSGKKVRLTSDSIKKIIDAEHSLSESIIFEIVITDVKTFVSTHLARHRIGVTHFISSNRNANFEVTRDTLVNHMMVINYQALRNMAKKRLCKRASLETQQVLIEIKKQIEASPYAVLGELLQPMCVYRGGVCHEPVPCKSK